LRLLRFLRRDLVSKQNTNIAIACLPLYPVVRRSAKARLDQQVPAVEVVWARVPCLVNNKHSKDLVPVHKSSGGNHLVAVLSFGALDLKREMRTVRMRI
jgi:hypothetical protein